MNIGETDVVSDIFERGYVPLSLLFLLRLTKFCMVNVSNQDRFVETELQLSIVGFLSKQDCML